MITREGYPHKKPFQDITSRFLLEMKAWWILTIICGRRHAILYYCCICLSIHLTPIDYTVDFTATTSSSYSVISIEDFNACHHTFA